MGSVGTRSAVAWSQKPDVEVVISVLAEVEAIFSRFFYHSPLCVSLVSFTTRETRSNRPAVVAFFSARKPDIASEQIEQTKNTMQFVERSRYMVQEIDTELEVVQTQRQSNATGEYREEHDRTHND